MAKVATPMVRALFSFSTSLAERFFSLDARARSLIHVFFFPVERDIQILKSLPDLSLSLSSPLFVASGSHRFYSRFFVFSLNLSESLNLSDARDLIGFCL
jgi:hypothetical protein